MLSVGVSAILAGCMGTDLAETTRNAFSGASPDKQATSDAAKAQPALAGGTGGTGENASSLIIDGLLDRQSVLGSGNSYSKVAGAVLAANSRAAEAELRSAKLRAQAASKNWLPTIGPNLSLTSLGEVVAGMLIDQVLFANGRKKAERQFAKADVEVAAVVLAEDTNDRVLTALDLYISAEEARAKARAGDDVLTQMERFAYIMQRRVEGGVSDRADLQVTRQKLAEIESNRASDAQAAATAVAELNAMSLTPLDGVRGLAAIKTPSATAKPLAVLKAEAERERAVAQATIDRSGFLPTVSARGNVAKGGSSASIDVAAENPIGFGTGASLKAIEAAREAASRKVDQADEDSARVLRRLEQQLIALEQKQASSELLVSQANENLALFERQYKAGVRPVMDVVRVYETKVRVEREQIGYAFKAAAVRLKVAAELGVLVDGADI